MMKNNKASLAILPLVLSAQLASAATTFFSADTTTGFFDTPTDVPEFGTSFVNISNGNGLSAPVNTLTEATIGATVHTFGFISGNQVVRDGAGADSLQADFGFSAAQSVTSIFVWNYTQPGCCENRGVGNFEIYLDTGSGFGGVADYTGTLSAVDQSASPDNSGHTPQEISFGGVESNVVAIRFVGLDRTGPGGNAIGLDEVVFAFDDTTIPEPSSALLGILGMFGLVRRRR